MMRSLHTMLPTMVTRTATREIFYSASTEEEVNGPVQDVEARIDEDAKRNKDGDCAMPKAGPSEDADESDDSAKVTYEGRQLGEVITLSSDEESPVDIMSEPEEPDTEGSLDSNSEVPSGTVDLADSSHEESFGNESEVHASDYDTESVDMEKMEANEVENFSIDDLYDQVCVMADHYTAFNLEDVRKLKLRLMELVDEDRDMTDREYEVWQRLSYIVDRISGDSLSYLAVGDGLRQDEEGDEDNGSDQINCVDEEDEETVDMLKAEEESDGDVVDMEKEGAEDGK